MRLRKSRYGLFYGCPEYPNCKGAHGAHKDGTPYGIPGNELTKQWRQIAHQIFDGWWRENHITRNDAYETLGDYMKLSREETHIGRFDIEKCQKVLDFIKGWKVHG